ncbi:YpjP-like protein [Schinkia azotoformans MEV2011]|uniref:YpjP-like protein n=1 Tax=Schinkia azotoformans MEV2011 TaxID=1348973 RepID=A0A072NXJ4_SCHAZ|nr:YpjP family protein [Schinkia azotoformans]KEF37960.1 YpjP-like protein [Schinkia azotoformans MEV2011]MEC1696318.1 YpjP family protein [Schinkia azotoformans]MEC1727276.1 YpjP family protein [Schinkia azotoformans]MEC1770800.1 YpjP family protein [Schinkia azotoformans]MEC1780836.1 YpjP family protein [Schinkia azotoformans]
MKFWMRKLFVVLVTIFTFGTVVPQLSVDIDKNVKENSDVSDQNDRLLVVNDIEALEEIETEEKSDHSWQSLAFSIDNHSDLVTSFTAYSMIHAEQQSMMKFGSTIGDVIGDEFKQVILPKIEEAIAGLAERVPEDDLRQLVISENPTSGLGEKIFHVYHSNTGKDLIRFHVRRDHPPKEGYWFNFHYHTAEDEFLTHYDMGSIYWDKNTPPHWMSA